jgi:predicted house-cleaning noncanonical NTP pyrophosphatase (MazG superfamily)
MSPVTPHPGGYPIKLVRDNTAGIVNPSGEPGELFYGPLNGELLPWLRKKLGEETTEFLVDGGISELSQVLSVVDALATQLGTTLDELIQMFLQDPRGGFSKGIMMYGRHPEYDR